MQNAEEQGAGQKPKKMKWAVLYAVEREGEIEADNLNIVCKEAEEGRKEGEKIIVVRLKRGQNVGGHGL